MQENTSFYAKSNGGGLRELEKAMSRKNFFVERISGRCFTNLHTRDVLAVLRPLVNQLATERLVYFLRSFLSQQNHGEQFCLAGKITCVPRPTNIQYRFDLLMALQVRYLNIPLDPVNVTWTKCMLKSSKEQCCSLLTVVKCFYFPDLWERERLASPARSSESSRSASLL